ncbi:hypothetical protein [Nostoc sp.]
MPQALRDALRTPTGILLHVVSPREGVLAVACGKPLRVSDKLSFLAIFA